MMGVTFSKYVMNRKISHACYLLETTDWTVDRIAKELGFCDISHFIQRFKAIKEVTPMAYRSASLLYQKKLSIEDDGIVRYRARLSPRAQEVPADGGAADPHVS